jgi:hypothetical protein
VLNQVLDLFGHTLVGKFLGRRVGMDCLLSWMERHWGIGLGYTLKAHLLAKEWLEFIFRSKENVFLVLTMKYGL